MFILFALIVILFSVIIHEISHGYVAEYLGDPTARIAGRLTLNPLSHLDLFGSFIFPAILLFAGWPPFGWAKPVPYNPYNLKDPRTGGGLIALAGPLSNIVIAFFVGMAARGLVYLAIFDSAQIILIHEMLSFIVSINLTLAFFNLLPIPPIDGSKVLTLILPIRAQLYLEAFWARVWMIFQENFLLSMIILFLSWPYIFNVILFFLRPITSFFSSLFIGSL